MAQCILCGGVDFKVLYTIPDLMLGNFDISATYVKCKKCGLIFQNPQNQDDEINNLYPKGYSPYNNPESRSRKSIIQMPDVGNAKRWQIISRFKKSGSLLDVGCAAGEFLGKMSKNADWDLFGVEVNPIIAEIAREKASLNIFTGTLEEAGYKDHTFDVITYWDVLEHIKMPINTLHETHRILKPNGYLVMRIPNAANWNARLFGKFWAGFDSPRHFYAFNPATIKKLLNQTNFQIEQMNSRFGGYASLVISLSFWLRGVGWETLKIDRLKTILNHPVSQLFAAPFFFLDSFTISGPTLIIVARTLKAGGLYK